MRTSSGARLLPDRVAGDPGERIHALLVAGAPSAQRMPMKPALRAAAGVTAGRNLALSLVEEDLGREVALARRRAAQAGRARMPIRECTRCGARSLGSWA